jgi:transcriptional regulator with XRE-family HTH domain
MTQTSLGHRLRLLRAERQLSLRQAAARAGVVKETISDIERGATHPQDVTLAKLAHAYEVPVEELLEEPVPLAEAPREAGPGEAAQADYPYPWMGDALARTVDFWREDVGHQRDPKHSHMIALSCLDILRPVLRLDVPGDTLRERVPEEEEFSQRARVAEMLFKLAERAQNHYVDSKEAEDAEKQAVEQRREDIKRRTRELGA